MNKLFTTLLGVAAVAAPMLLLPPAASAADDRTCDEAKTVVVKLQADVDDASAKERVAELAEAKVAVTAAKAALDAAQAAVPPVEATIKAAKEKLETAKALRDAAQKKFDTDSGKLAGLRARLSVAVNERDNICSGVTTTPPPPVDRDVDCDEVSDARAQQILDNDRDDPNNLDDDGDGIACEEDVIVEQVVVPNGGVNTGVGPA